MGILVSAALTWFGSGSSASDYLLQVVIIGAGVFVIEPGLRHGWNLLWAGERIERDRVAAVTADNDQPRHAVQRLTQERDHLNSRLDTRVASQQFRKELASWLESARNSLGKAELAGHTGDEWVETWAENVRQSLRIHGRPELVHVFNRISDLPPLAAFRETDPGRRMEAYIRNVEWLLEGPLSGVSSRFVGEVAA